MFSDLTSGLESKKFMTPISSSMINNTPPGMIAEPAQVVVLMPGSRAEKAENALGQLKTYISIFSTIAGIIIISAFYFWFRGSKKPHYSGKTLPGIAIPDATVMIDRAKEASKPAASYGPSPEATEKYEKQPVIKPVVSFEDIVHVDGPIPIWDTPDEEPTSGEKRVSENDESIANIIKAREALTKDIESFMSTGMKT